MGRHEVDNEDLTISVSNVGYKAGLWFLHIMKYNEDMWSVRTAKDEKHQS